MPDTLSSSHPTWWEIQRLVEGMRPEDQGQDATQHFIPFDVFDAGYHSRSISSGLTPEDTDLGTSTTLR